MTSKISIILVCMLIKLVSSVRIPINPCPKVFSYYKDTNGGVYGEATVPYDRSTTMTFSVNASLAAIFNSKANLKLMMVTTTNELKTAEKVIYNVFFPSREIIPKITQITYNDVVYCRGPQEPLIPGGSGITNTWSSTIFKYTRGASSIPTNNPVYVDTGISDDEIPVKDPNVHRPAAQTPVRIPNIPSREPHTESPGIGYNTVAPPKSQVDIGILQPFTKAPVEKNRHFRCGIPNNLIDTHILKGTKVEDAQFPWLTALFSISEDDDFNYKCSATLISEKHVVTAGLCVQYFNIQVLKTEDILLVMGTSDLGQWSSNGAIIRRARAVTTHPDFKKNSKSAHADISLITMDKPVEFSSVLRPVCLWKGNSDLSPITDMMGTIAGYGQDEQAQNEKKLHVFKARYAEIPIVSRRTCLISNISFNDITSDKTFCAGGEGRGPCIGDNGAGFVLPIEGVYHLRGVASLSSSKNGICHFQKKYAIFCDVAKFMDWLKSSMKG